MATLYEAYFDGDLDLPDDDCFLAIHRAEHTEDPRRVPAWFEGVNTVLLTAGASAPEHLVQEIIEQLVTEFDGTVTDGEGVEENVHFNLPRSLRVLQGA